MPRYSFRRDDLPLSSQDASAQPPRTYCLPLLRLEWRRARKITLVKVFVITVLNVAWIYAVHKHHVRSQQTIELASTAYALQIREDETHHVFESAKLGLTSQSPLRIRAYDSMSDDCVEEWVARHEWGPACAGTDLSEGLKIDGVWSWVNGSDPLQIATRQRYRPSGSMRMDAMHRYTEHDELLFSMRSALASLGSNTMQRLHILASAYHLPNGSYEDMAGQVPIWLNKEEALDGNRLVVLHHDANFFKPTTAPGTDLSQPDLQKWKDAVIPSFNSLAVESQIHNIDSLDSDQLVYFNDDFFSLRKLAVSDYTTPLYGPVIKTFTRITSRYNPSEKTFYQVLNPAGEEPGIKRAA